MNKLPTSLIFFVTGKCNSMCEHCFYWKNTNKDRNELSTAEIDDFSKQLEKLNDISLSGGEPFLRDDITIIYDTFVKNNQIKNFSIPTNGMLPETIESKVKDMLKLAHNTNISISISVDGHSPLHDEIRGVKGSYNKSVETYQRLNRLRDEHNNLSLKVNTTLSNKNIKHVDEIIDSVSRDMPDIDFHNFELIRGNPKNKSYSVPSVKEIKGIRNQIFFYWDTLGFFKKSRIKSRIAINIKKRLFDINLETITKGTQIIKCKAHKTYCVLDEVGNLYFCEMLPPIGNIRESTFKEIWNSERANKQRKSIENKECWCTHSCFQQKNIIKDKKLLLLDAIKSI